MGGVLLLSPRQVDDLTFDELMAMFDGWKAANCGDGAPPPPTNEEHDALVAKYGG